MRDCWGTRWGGGCPFPTDPSSSRTGPSVLLHQKEEPSSGCNTASSSKQEKPVLHRDHCDSEGWQCLQVLESEHPAYVNAERITKGPNCRRGEVCDRQKQKRHMPQGWGTQCLRSTCYLTTCHRVNKPSWKQARGSQEHTAEVGTERRQDGLGKSRAASLTLPEGREGEPGQGVLETGNEGGEGKHWFKANSYTEWPGQRKRGAHPRKEYSCLWAQVRDSSASSAVLSVSFMKQSNNLQTWQFPKCTSIS